MVNDEVLRADKIFINVGGRASIPPLPGIHDVSFLTNSSMMDVDFRPEHLVIVAGSYIGWEFGQMYRDSRRITRTFDPNAVWVQNESFTLLGYGIGY